MDGNRFDDLSKLIGAGASRRSILKGLLGLGGAAATGAAAQGVADARTRPRITTSPPPVCAPGHQFCGGQGAEYCCPPGRCFDGHCCPDEGTEGCGDGCCPVGQCTTDGDCCPSELKPCGTVCCAKDSTCGRSGNTDICCGGLAAGAPCGLDCCEDPYQCCDLECCGSDAVCMTRVFGSEGAGIAEEVCCPANSACDGQCCDGVCFVREGLPLAFNGFPFALALAERECCPTGQSVCQGDANAECCDPVTEECCERNGVAICIPLGGCCLDEECGDPCLVCDSLSSVCVNPCTEDEFGPYCCPAEVTQGYICVANDDCCPGDECGACGECLNGLCAEAPLGDPCLICETCAEQTTGLFECVADPTQAGDSCEQCRLCDENGGCTVIAPDTASCQSITDGICCDGDCSVPGTCTTTTTPDPLACEPCFGNQVCRLGECCLPVGNCCSFDVCEDICCTGAFVGISECGQGYACNFAQIGGTCSADSDCRPAPGPAFCNDDFICQRGTRPAPTTTTTAGPVVTTTSTTSPATTTTTSDPVTTTSTESPGPTTQPPTTTEAPCTGDGQCGTGMFCHEGSCEIDRCFGDVECANCATCDQLQGCTGGCEFCEFCSQSNQCETIDVPCCRNPDICGDNCSCDSSTGVCVCPQEPPTTPPP